MQILNIYTIPVAGDTVNPTTTTITERNSTTLTATVSPANAPQKSNSEAIFVIFKFLNFLNNFCLVRKSVLITIFAISLLGCDDNVGEQGRCDEGFAEQLGPDGTYFCAQINEEG